MDITANPSDPLKKIDYQLLGIATLGTSTEDHRSTLYEKYVSSGQASSDEGRAKPYLTRLIRTHLPENRQARIVEVGCGGGEFLHFCRAAGYRDLRGIELSSEQVARAASRGMADVVVLGDLFGYLSAMGDFSCDVLVAFDVVEHLTKSEILKFFDEAFRTLSHRGRLIIHVPNAESPFVGSVRYGDFTHEVAFTPGSVRQLALTVGFASVRCYEDTPIPHGIKSTIRAALWPLCRWFLISFTAVETGGLNTRAVLSRNMLAVIERP